MLIGSFVGTLELLKTSYLTVTVTLNVGACGSFTFHGCLFANFNVTLPALAAVNLNENLPPAPGRFDVEVN